jgi:heat shock protein HslJ
VGRFTLEGERIRTRPQDPIVTSKCERPEYARWERDLHAFMAAASTWTLLPDGALQITARDGRTGLFRRPEPIIPALAGKWEVERIGRETIQKGRSVRVAFQADWVSATAECNSMGGQLIPEKEGFRVKNPMQTLIGCGPERQKFDSRLFGAVGKARSYAVLPDGRLRLEGGPEALVLRRFRLEPWQQQLPGAYTACGSNPVGVSYNGPPSVTFDAGTVRDNAGCRGTYTTDGAKLRIRLENFPACSAEPAPLEGEIEVHDKSSLLAVLRPDAYAFDDEGLLRVRTRRGPLDLCRTGRRWFGHN